MKRAVALRLGVGVKSKTPRKTRKGTLLAIFGLPDAASNDDLQRAIASLEKRTNAINRSFTDRIPINLSEIELQSDRMTIAAEAFKGLDRFFDPNDDYIPPGIVRELHKHEGRGALTVSERIELLSPPSDHPDAEDIAASLNIVRILGEKSHLLSQEDIPALVLQAIEIGMRIRSSHSEPLISENIRDALSAVRRRGTQSNASLAAERAERLKTAIRAVQPNSNIWAKSVGYGKEIRAAVIAKLVKQTSDPNTWPSPSSIRDAIIEMKSTKP